MRDGNGRERGGGDGFKLSYLKGGGGGISVSHQVVT